MKAVTYGVSGVEIVLILSVILISVAEWSLMQWSRYDTAARRVIEAASSIKSSVRWHVTWLLIAVSAKANQTSASRRCCRCEPLVLDTFFFNTFII